MVKIAQICEDLGLTNFIDSLPNRLYTYIGENGVNLSGGQKQRFAIARALYKNPEILILDEATSALDSISEKYVHKIIKNLKNQQKTIIIIAHRIRTVLNADKIVVLKNGKLVEEGTHNNLIHNRSIYYDLWQEQTINLMDPIL